jgi:hypothetical protein
MSHTPGPWHSGERLLIGRYLIRDDNGEIIAEVVPLGSRETTANARLIAAAPAMYVALKELYRLGLQGWRENRQPPTLVSEGMQVVVLAKELIRDLNVVDPATLTEDDWMELNQLLNGIDALQRAIGGMA